MVEKDQKRRNNKCFLRITRTNRGPYFLLSWEQRKLREFVGYTSSALSAKDSDVNGQYDLYDANEVIGKTNANFMSDDYITIIKDGAGVGRVRILPKNTYFIGTMGALTSSLCSLDFVYTLLCSVDLGKKYSGSTIPHIYFKDYGEDLYYIPKNEEMESISEFFKKIDNLITLHQCKCLSVIIGKAVAGHSRQFPENANDWEQRKFSELYRKVSEKNDLTYGKEDIISVANMYFKEDSYITDNEYLRTYNVFLLGDIAFEGNKSKDFKHGRFVENTIGNGIVSHVFDVFRPIMVKYDLLFWKYAINNERLMGQILVRSTKASTMMTNLVADDFLNEFFLVPEYEEQKAIGKTLSAIDNLITLHQCEGCDKNGCQRGDKKSRNELKQTNDWEQRKLGTFADKVIEKNSNMTWRETFTNSAEFGIISQRDFFDHDVSKETSLGGYYIVQENDFVYNPRISVSAPVGPINCNKLGRKGVMSPLYTVFRVKNVDFVYLEYFFKTKIWHSYMRFNGDTGARSDRFSIKDDLFFEMPIPLPQIDEQQKIGLMLTNVDNLITLHQCKENGKKLCFRRVEKMIENKKKTNDWEQRKFEELFLEKREKTEQEFEDKLLSCAINGIFLNSELFSHFRGTSTIGYLKIKKYDLILSAQNLHLGNANVNLRFESGIISPAYKVFEINKECEPEFIQAWVKKEDTKQFFLSATTEGASQCRKNIEWNELNKQLVCVPKREEQVAVGKLIMAIDNLITLHRCKDFELKGKKNVSLTSQKNLKKTTSWEQRKLGTIATEIKRVEPNDTAPIMMITAGNGFIEQSERYAYDNAGESLKKYILLKKGELAYNHGASKLRPYGSCFALLHEKARIPFVYHCFSVEKHVPEFVSIVLNGIEIEKQLRRIVSSGARMDGLLNISFEEYTSVELSLPEEQEQSKIAEIFDQLDNLITLHQRGLIYFKEIKNDKRNKKDGTILRLF